MKRQLFILTAPSGTGKTTVLQRVLAQRPDTKLSVSHTTRAPRPGEANGREYLFVDVPTFEELVAEGAFLEWAEVHGNYYGTSRKAIDELMAKGYHVIADIDPQGGRAMLEQAPDAVAIFLLPPSITELERRLRGRGTEPEDVVRRRLRNARGELATARLYHYAVVNDDLEQAVGDVCRILDAAPLRRDAQRDLIDRLQAEPLSWESGEA